MLLQLLCIFITRAWKLTLEDLPKIMLKEGRGCGQLVSVLSFYSDDPSWNPAEVYSFIL